MGEIDQTGDGREYFRTTAAATVHFGPDTEAARQTMAVDADLWRTQSKHEQAARNALELDSDEQVEGVMAVLRWMDFKLDLVLHQLRLSQHAVHFPHTASSSDLSGSGMGLRDAEGVGEGETILLALELPDAPYRAVYASAKVIWVNQSAGPDEVSCAIQFEDISDSDRERIIRYTFRQQRRQLAKRSEEAAS